jgi:hypothetical protein
MLMASHLLGRGPVVEVHIQMSVYLVCAASPVSYRTDRLCLTGSVAEILSPYLLLANEPSICFRRYRRSKL